MGRLTKVHKDFLGNDTKDFELMCTINEAVNKLAEYENIGPVKEFRDAKLAQVLLIHQFLKEKKELKHELAVHKKALEIADLETEGMKEYLLEKARKELLDGKRS